MTTISWETLNAYVDRELDAPAAAEVAAAMAIDPSLAARVATISRLKAAASTMPAPEGAPVIPAGGRGARARFGWRKIAAAASIALLVAAGGSAAWLAMAPDADPVSATIAAERGWLAGVVAEGARAGVRVSVDHSATDSLPDLSSAGLRLAYLATDPGSAAPRGLFAGYLGPNGCRLGLWIGRGSAAPVRPERRDLGDVGVRRWSAGGVDYALISRGMDARRLDGFATAVADLVGRPGGPDDRLRTALKDAAGTGAACIG